MAEQAWQFALQRYQRPEVESLCLGLQDGWQMNVTLLLFLAFLSEQGIVCTKAEVEEMRAKSAQLDRDLLVELRQLRRRSKFFLSPDGYHHLKRAELDAERQLLEMLCGVLLGSQPNVRTIPVNGSLIPANFAIYAQCVGCGERGEEGGPLQQLAAALA